MEKEMVLVDNLINDLLLLQLIKRAGSDCEQLNVIAHYLSLNEAQNQLIGSSI